MSAQPTPAQEKALRRLEKSRGVIAKKQAELDRLYADQRAQFVSLNREFGIPISMIASRAGITTVAVRKQIQRKA